ncbi:hypothetical protein B5D77_08660 [Microcystis sp. MC19]|nr:hypothetical protein B5D77_08660 [Microcystis sp. MC19]
MLGGIEVKNLKFPMESCSIFYFAYSPELQPAERLWSLVDAPLVNEHFKTHIPHPQLSQIKKAIKVVHNN